LTLKLMMYERCVEVDASRAGVGNLEITITSASDSPTNFVEPESTDQSHYRVTFTPLKPETYNIVVKFNADPVPGDRRQIRYDR